MWFNKKQLTENSSDQNSSETKTDNVSSSKMKSKENNFSQDTSKGNEVFNLMGWQII